MTAITQLIRNVGIFSELQLQTYAWTEWKIIIRSPYNSTDKTLQSSPAVW